MAATRGCAAARAHTALCPSTRASASTPCSGTRRSVHIASSPAHTSCQAQRCAQRDTPIDTCACDHSAFDDSRFRPVTEDEVPRLACTVNLLFAFEKCDDCFDWKVRLAGVWSCVVLCAHVCNTSTSCVSRVSLLTLAFLLVSS